MFKYKYSKLYWFLKDLEWLKVYFSPFKFFLPKLYIGKTAIGVPYFLPRRWVKATHEKALEATLKHIKETKEFNEKNSDYKRVVKSFGEIYDAKMKCTYSVPLKVGFSFCSLGWKTKWGSFRHEYNPVWSVVCFGYQIALIFRPDDDMQYWECFLSYTYDTDKSKSPQDRLKEAKEKHPCIWTSYEGENEITTDYWTKVIKNKYV